MFVACQSEAEQQAAAGGDRGQEEVKGLMGGLAEKTLLLKTERVGEDQSRRMKESVARILPGNQRLSDASSSCRVQVLDWGPTQAPAPCSRFVLVQLSTSDRQLHVGSTPGCRVQVTSARSC